MPFQLIHTSSPHLLDSSASGYGTVARSVDMPAALYRLLPPLSAPKADEHPLQFSYRILTAGGNTWHVLSCIQSAGADYSGRACHTAHHLVFSQQEVSQLLNNKQRPTPAGISLALLHSGFWVKKWEKEPQFLPPEPPFEPERQPDASVQPTWKQFTGHKANARAFYVPPYHKESLVVIPPAMQQAEILALLHESDWLSHTRGWGNTYTTAADETNTFTETLRIIAPAASPLILRAQRTGHPVLHINAELELPITPPTSITGVQDNSKSRLIRALSRSTTHYHYTEEPDWTLFDIPIPCSPYKKAAWSTALSLTGCCSALILWWAFPSPGTGGITTPHTTTESRFSQSPRSRLTDLLSHPYSHESARRLMQELSLIKGPGAEEIWIAECAGIILKAETQEAEHARGLKRICECARLLGVQEAGLVQLYLRAATHSITPEEWQRQLAAGSAEEWLKLQLSEPTVGQVFETQELEIFAPLYESTNEDEAPILATADSSSTPTPDTILPPVPGRVSLIPVPAKCGESIPRPLAQVLTRLPQTIATGRFIVSSFQKGDSLQPSQQLDLTEDGYRLHLAATENNGEYRLTASHKEGKHTNLPEILISTRNGKLRSVRSEQGFAAISFPIPQQGDFYTNIILAPEFGIPIPDGKSASLPESSELNFQITPADIKITGLPDKPRLSLSEKRTQTGFPWIQDKKLTGKHQFHIVLPVLNAHNSIAVTQDSQSAYSCQKTSVLKETEQLTTLLCDMEHKPALPYRLELAFDRIANTPCCGLSSASKGDPTLAELYSIISQLGGNKLSASARRQLHQSYFRLVADKHFNNELRKILPAMVNLIPDARSATAGNLRSRRLRRSISTELDKPGIQDAIRTGICQLLSRSLLAAYEQEKQNFENSHQKRPILMLQRITQGEHGELLWHFHLQQSQ